jgi:uncharacterized protein YjiS (DUF1127 family)
MTMTEISRGLPADCRRSWPNRSQWDAAGQALANFVTMLLDWQERARQRRQLLALGDRDLMDFGRSLADAAHEGSKPFWRA